VHTAPGGDLTQIRPRADRDVSVDVHPAQVRVVGVGAGEHVATAAQRLVRDDRQLGDADRAEAAGRAPRACSISSGRRGAKRRRPGGVDELLLAQRVITAQAGAK